MSIRIFLVYIWVAGCLLISACSAPATATIPTEAPQSKIEYVPGVGRILSSTPITVFPQKIHIGPDALWYWFEECMCIAKLDPLSGKETTLFNIGEGKAGPYGNP